MQRPLLRQAGIALGLALFSSPLLGQVPAGSEQPAQTPAGQTSPAGNPGAVAPGTGSQPVPGGPLGSFAPQVGGQTPATGNGLAAQSPPADPGTTGPTSGPQLPEDYQPPGSPPAIITNIPDPDRRSSDEEIQQLEQELRRLDNRGIDAVLLSGDPSETNKQGLAKWAKLQADRMMAADSRREISNIGAYVAQKVRTAASQQNNSNRQREFREAMAEALTKELGYAMLNSNLYVRLQSAALLKDLNLVEASVRGDEPPVAYTPAIGALLDAIEDSEGDAATDRALQAVKIAAAAGIRRLASDSPTIDVDLRYRAADVLTKELAKADTHFWYQMVLAEALAAIEMELDRARNPVVVTALMSVISDSERHCAARAAAAKALSRTPIVAGQFDEEAAAAAIQAMGREFALEYNKNPDSRKWPFCFHDLSLAFRVGQEEENADLPENCLLRRGTLPAPYQTVQQRLEPVITHVLSQGPSPANPTPIPSELLQPLNQAMPGTAAVSTE